MPTAKPAIRWRRFALLLAALAAVNVLLLALYFHDRLAWRWVLVLDWPARFLVPRESEEALGPLGEAAVIWLAALPWLALCAALLSLGRPAPGER
jgi:hypothetical protein